MSSLLLIFLTTLRVAFVGDPQVDNTRELDFARRSIYRELQSRKDLDYVIVLGDIVNENPGLIEPSQRILDSLGCPWIRVQGNHDGQDFPRDTSFYIGDVHFIMVNRYGLTQNRKDIPDSVSLKILETIKPGEKTVVCSHVPIKDSITDKYDSDVLFASAHLHTVFRDSSAMGAILLGAGASCGSWWRGIPDADGIPAATMNCGAPRCYFVADFHEGRKQWYSLEFKAVAQSARIQAGVAAKDSTLVFDVYGAAPWGRLQAKVGGKWVEVPYESVIAPESQAVIDYNKRVMTKEYRRTHKDEFIPMLGWKSPHTFVLKLGEPVKEKRIKIRYCDPAMRFRQTLQ